jgi:hypothetical protein
MIFNLGRICLEILLENQRNYKEIIENDVEHNSFNLLDF